MAQEPRTKRDRIERLRERLNQVAPPHTAAQLVSVIKGILDLLADEL